MNRRTVLHFAFSCIVVAGLMLVGARPGLASPGVTFVGSEQLNAADPAFTDTSGPEHPIVFQNVSFPDGTNTATEGILFNEQGTGNFLCGSGCPDGPNSKDYCHVTVDDVASCDFQSQPSGTQCANYTGSMCYYVGNGQGEYHEQLIQSGGSIVVDGDPHIFNGISPGTAQNGGTTLQITFRNLLDVQGIVVYLNNNGPAGTSTNGCFTFSSPNAGTSSAVASVGVGNGEFLQWKVQLAQGEHRADLVESNGACGTGSATAGNVNVAGVFFLWSPPTIAPVSRLTIRPANGGTLLTWRAIQQVIGFNVFAGTHRLNRHLVVGHANRYRFWTAQRVSHVRLVPVFPAS